MLVYRLSHWDLLAVLAWLICHGCSCHPGQAGKWLLKSKCKVWDGESGHGLEYLKIICPFEGSYASVKEQWAGKRTEHAWRNTRLFGNDGYDYSLLYIAIGFPDNSPAVVEEWWRRRAKAKGKRPPNTIKKIDKTKDTKDSHICV